MGRCDAPQPQDTYAALPDPNVMTEAGEELSFACAETGAYVGGNPPQTRMNLTCLDDGTFPSVAWPKCQVMCMAPELPSAAYTDPERHTGE